MTKIELKEDEKKILEFLEEKYPRDYSVTQISEELDMNRSSVSMYVDFLKRMKKVIMTRNVGRSKLYTINKSSDMKNNKKDQE